MGHEKGTGTACCFDVAESCSFTNRPNRSLNYALHKIHRVKPCKATSFISSTKSLPFSHQEGSKNIRLPYRLSPTELPFTFSSNAKTRTTSTL